MTDGFTGNVGASCAGIVSLFDRINQKRFAPIGAALVPILKDPLGHDFIAQLGDGRCCPLLGLNHVALLVTETHRRAPSQTR